MPRKRVLRKKPVRVADRSARFQSAFSRRSAFETLEDRRMLTGYFDTIATAIAGPQDLPQNLSALMIIEKGLKGVESVAHLPMIEKSIGDIGELSNTVEDFRKELYSTLTSLNPATGEAAVRNLIYTTLGPDGLGILVSKVHPAPGQPPPAVTPSDVVLTLTDTSVDLSIDIGFNSDHSTKTDLPLGLGTGMGVNSVPFKPHDVKPGKLAVSLVYSDFHIVYDTTHGVDLITNTSNNELQLTLLGYLPSSFTAGLGFLNVLVTDHTPGTDAGDEDLKLTLTSDITGGLRQNDPPLNVDIPHLTGGLNLDAHVQVQADAIGKGMPQIQTDMLFKWMLPDVSANVPLGTSWGAPELAFNHVQIELGSLLGNLARPIADNVESILEPLQPVFDILQKRIPGLSDISEALGQGEVNLLSLDKLLQDLPGGVVPSGIADVLNEASTLIRYYNTINDLVSAASGWIDVGSFHISGPGGASLLDPMHTLDAGLAELGLGDWSNLIGDNPGAAFDNITGQISQLIPGPVGDEVNDLWQQLNPAPNDNGLAFTYPIVTRPADVLLGMLLGQDKDMVTASIKYKEKFDASFKIPIIPLFFIVVDVKANVDAFAQIGYDTHGLQEAVAPFYNPTLNHGNFDGSKLMDGLWIAPSTHFHLDADIKAGAGVGVPDVVSFKVTGGLDGSLDVNIANDHVPKLTKIRPFAGDLHDKLFDVDNKVYGVITGELEVGLPTPFGFIGFDKEWTFAKTLLFEFTGDHFDVPTTLIPPPISPPSLFDYRASDHTLVLRTSAGDESFTVKHVSHIDFFGFPNHLISDTFDISSGGVNQRFIGRVDEVDANLGGGNDTLNVIDQTFGPTLYVIDGDDGDDTIDIDGSVNVQLYGGAGKDTIDAGNGRNGDHKNIVDGGPDSDKITFGEGVLSNMVADANFYIVRFDSNDQSLDRVLIDNSRSKTNSFYRFYDNLAPYDESLEIDAGEGGVRWFYMSQYDAVTLYSGSGTDTFTGVPSSSSQLFGGPGNDAFIIGNSVDQPLPVRPVSHLSLTIPTITLNGGAGFDSVTLTDTLTHTPRTYLLGVSTGTSASAFIGWADANSMAFRTTLAGMEATNFRAYTTSTVQVSGWDASPLDLEAGAVKLAANNAMWWDTTITINDTPNITFYDGDADSSVSGGGIDENGPYLFLQGDHRINVDFNEFVGQVTAFTYQVDQAVVDLTPGLLAKPWNLSFAGSSRSTLYVISPNYNSPTGTAPDYSYFLESNMLVVNSKQLKYNGIGDIRILSGQGNDSLVVEDYPAGGIGVLYNGGFGNDTLKVDVRLDTTNSLWSIAPDVIWNVLHFSVNLSNVESTQILGGKGNDMYIVTDQTNPVAKQFNTPLIIDGGGGNDTFTLGEADFPATFNAPIRIEGNDGDDVFTWYGVNNGSDANVFEVTVDGGAGTNTLVVDDQTRFTSPTNYDINAHRIRAQQVGYTVFADFNFFNMSALTVSASDNNDTFDVNGISSDIDATNQVTILGNGGADTVRVHPFDVEGTFMLSGNLGIGGGAGADLVVVDNSNTHRGIAYGFYNQFGPGTTNVSGFSEAGFGVASDVEQLQILAGSGDDSFNIDSYLSSGTSLSIAAGAGDDVLEVTPTGKNIEAGFSDAVTYSFDGGDGMDSFNLYNNNNSQAWTYIRDANNLTLLSPGEYRLDLVPQSFESWKLAGGTYRDTLYADNLPSGELMTFEGGGGYDALSVGFLTSSANGMRGQLVFDGGDGGGALNVYDYRNSTGATLHIENDGVDDTLGSTSGDTLFGPGGSIRYRNVSDEGDGAGVNVILGSGPDTIYAAPLATATISIDAGEPSEGAGDKLNLATAQAQNPTVQNFGNGSGRLTSSNRMPIVWTSIEQLSTGYVPPSKFVVTNTLDSGPGSLRQAILDANATANVGSADVIRFAIPGNGTHTIRPLSELPTITDPVVLDATMQPGFAGKPVIELDGSLAANSNGLTIFAGGSTVRGFAMNRFTGTPNGFIVLSGGGGNIIQGNYLGTNLAGTAGFPLANQGSYGVIIFGSSNNIIGTDGDGVNDSAEGNVCSGTNTAGILIESGQPSQPSSNNVIAGNLLGTSADGNAALPNGRMGIFLLSGIGNRIGTNSDGISDVAERNLISGNAEDGVYLGGDANIVAGNLLGTNLAGTAALPNNSGIIVQNASNNRIGGTAAGAGNVIANSNYLGVWIQGGAGNSVLGNSIYNNGQLGIGLWSATDAANGVTLNDATDADSGSNNLQNYPQITTAISGSGQTLISGTLQSTPNTTFRIELFASGTADPSGHGEGQVYLSFVSATTDAAGNASFLSVLPTALAPGQYLSATATDPSGNTSEFATNVQVASASTVHNVAVLHAPTTGGVFLVTSPAGSTITASMTPSSTVAPPSGVAFPFGFLSFTITGLSPAGATANVTISGLDVTQVTDYYKNGATPANHAAHWYDFLFGQATDSDSPAGTGMQIVGEDVILHLIDGQRGDDDLAANGVIVDIGGPVLNHPPVATNDTATTNKNTAVAINVLTNDTDTDGTVKATTVAIVSPAGHGTTSVNPTTGVVTYTPAANYTGLDSFTYKVKDNLGATSNAATVSITVNAPPLAVNDTAVVTKNTPLAINVLGNDSDPDGMLNPATVAIVGAASHGTASVNPTTGAITYTPASNYKGPDSFTYKVKDNFGAASNVATVSVTVDTPPAAGNDTASTYKNAAVVINVLSNDSDPDGTLNAATVAIVAAAGHGTTSVNPTTGAITYTPAVNYTGPDSFTYKVKDNLGTGSNVATVSITVIPTGTIAGKEYLDVTGNGPTADDTPLSGVKVFLDTNNNGAWNTGEPAVTTLADGSYVFPDLIAGTYRVRQVTPTGFVRTAPATVDYYSVALAAGQASSGNSFSNAALGNLAALSNIVYLVNGTTPVSDLRGTTKEGDTVQVSFTVVAGTQPQRFTLVSYTAPGSAYDANTAAQQKLFDSDTGVFSPGTYTLTVSNPHSFFQVDFVGGYAIDHLGPANSNIFYSAQNRLFSADNGGMHAVLASPASLTGSVYRDANNNGTIESGEQAIAGVKVTATAGSTTQTVVTDIYGVYTFDNLPAGTYTITETQPGDYTDGKDTLGNKGGTATNDKFSGIVLAAGASGTGYNFGEQQTVGSAFAGNQTQTIAWWNGSNGQALIKALNGGQTAKNLGNWLASNFNNLFGADAGSANNLAGKTTAQVAAYYQTLYANAARKPESEALALALAVYVTNSTLAGTTATSYGFAVSATGLGAATASIGANGAAFGVNNNSILTIAELLSRTNARARKGAVWDANGDGSLNSAESVLRNQATSLFDSINNA